MFRELTRKKQQLTKEECLALLQREKRGVLSVCGEQGYPYGMPMNHYYCEEDGCLYFHSGRAGHRADALAACGRVSFCVYDRGRRRRGEWALRVKSVIVFGDMEIVDDAVAVAEIAARLSRKFTDDEAYIQEEIRRYGKQTVLLRLRPLHMCGKAVVES